MMINCTDYRINTLIVRIKDAFAISAYWGDSGNYEAAERWNSYARKNEEELKNIADYLNGYAKNESALCAAPTKEKAKKLYDFLGVKVQS